MGVQLNDVKSVQEALERGADSNASWGKPALRLALANRIQSRFKKDDKSLHNSSTIIKLLLDSGADPDIEDGDPLRQALLNKDLF